MLSVLKVAICYVFYLLYTQKQLHKINFCEVKLLITFPIINGRKKKMENYFYKKIKKKKVNHF